MYRHKIVAADDEEKWRLLITTWLKEARYRFFITENGADVVPLAERHRPDCIILDFFLGDRDARQICREIRSKPHLRAVPIIILTGSAEQKVPSLAQYQADQFVVKNVDGKKELLATLIALFRRRELDTGTLKVGKVELNPAAQKVFEDGKLIAELSDDQFRFFSALVQKSGEYVGNRELHKIVYRAHWNEEDTGKIRALAHRTRELLPSRIARGIKNSKSQGWIFVPDSRPTRRKNPAQTSA